MTERIEQVGGDGSEKRALGTMGLAFERAGRRLRAGDRDAILRSYYEDERVLRIFKQLAHKSGLVDLVDEARQQVALMLHEDWLKKAKGNSTDGQGLYSLLYVLAQNQFRSLLQRVHADERRLLDLDSQDVVSGDEDESLTPAAFATADTTATDRRIDMERAQMELARRLSLVCARPLASQAAEEHPVVIIGAPNEVKARKRSSRANRVSADAAGAELLKIRDFLCVDTEEFAEMVGILSSTMASYLYGRVMTVPTATMEKARDLVASLSKDARRDLKMLETTSMPKVLAVWGKMLGLEGMPVGEANAALAKFLELDAITVWRWRVRDYKPRPVQLKNYHLRVVRAAQRSAK